MSKTTWAKVTTGAAVLLKGREWTVDKVKVKKGGKVKVTVSGTGGEFTAELDAKAKVELLEEGWADERKAAKVNGPRPQPEVHTPPKVSKKKAKAALDEPASDAERTVTKYLDAKLLAVEVDGVYLMPHPSPDTIAAHLLAFHGVTAEGVSLTEAKALARTKTPEAAVQLLSWDKLKAVHDREHEQIEAGTKAALVDHLHTKERPAS